MIIVIIVILTLYFILYSIENWSVHIQYQCSNMYTLYNTSMYYILLMNQSDILNYITYN